MGRREEGGRGGGKKKEKEGRGGHVPSLLCFSPSLHKILVPAANITCPPPPDGLDISSLPGCRLHQRTNRECEYFAGFLSLQCFQAPPSESASPTVTPAPALGLHPSAGHLSSGALARSQNQQVPIVANSPCQPTSCPCVSINGVPIHRAWKPSFSCLLTSEFKLRRKVRFAFKFCHEFFLLLKKPPKNPPFNGGLTHTCRAMH